MFVRLSPMRGKILVGIDPGTQQIRVIVGRFSGDESAPTILGMGFGPSEGFSEGYVTSVPEAVRSISAAIKKAEDAARMKIREAVFSFSGASLTSEIAIGSTVASKADGKITERDVELCEKDAERAVVNPNKRILHAYTLGYKLDGAKVQGRPEGMTGTKLEARVIFISALSRHIAMLVDVAEKLGIEIIDIIAAPIAAAEICLSPAQKLAGASLIDIGASNVVMAVYEDGVPLFVRTLPNNTGAGRITHDISIGFKIQLEEAESVKVGNLIGNYKPELVDKIIRARLGDIFDLVDTHLGKIKRSQLLPGGVVIVGGGANMPRVEEIARDTLELPAKVASAEVLKDAKSKLRDASWFTVFGLLFMARESHAHFESESVPGFWRNLKKFFGAGVNQLIP